MECLIYNNVKKNIFGPKKIEKLALLILKELKTDGQLSVHLIADKKMKKLNLLYRDKDKTTDILSFASENFFKKEKVLGDIFISVPQIKKQAKKYLVSEKEEFARILVHGILHLIGFDHLEKKEADKMFKTQEKILTKILCLV